MDPFFYYGEKVEIWDLKKSQNLIYEVWWLDSTLVWCVYAYRWIKTKNISKKLFIGQIRAENVFLTCLSRPRTMKPMVLLDHWPLILAFINAKCTPYLLLGQRFVIVRSDFEGVNTPLFRNSKILINQPLNTNNHFCKAEKFLILYLKLFMSRKQKYFTF